MFIKKTLQILIAIINLSTVSAYSSQEQDSPRHAIDRIPQMHRDAKAAEENGWEAAATGCILCGAGFCSAPVAAPISLMCCASGAVACALAVSQCTKANSLDIDIKESRSKNN